MVLFTLRELHRDADQLKLLLYFLGPTQVEEFVPVLVRLLDNEENGDTMLLACRALTYMMEVMPQSAAIVVKVRARFSLISL